MSHAQFKGRSRFGAVIGVGRVFALVAACAAALAAGCQSTRRAESSAGAASLYESRRYAEAYEEGKRGMDDADADLVSRQRSRLFAGLAANELKNYAEAKRLLGPLTASDEASIAGRAAAGLGLAYIGTEDYRRAAESFAQAAPRLQGDEAARAWMFAGDCRSLAGQVNEARIAHQSALNAARDPALRTQIQQKLAFGAFTVQVGAFSNRSNAEKALANLQSRAGGLGLGAPAIRAETNAVGKTIHAVQIGRFSTIAEAQAARAKIGGDAVVRQVAK